MTSLTLVRRIAAGASIVFDALTTPDAIACWWGPDDGPVLLAETDIRVGGRFRVRFRMLDGTEHESSGQYIEVVKPTRLVMSWRWTHGGEPEEAGEESRSTRERSISILNSPSPIRVRRPRRRRPATRRAGLARSTSWYGISPMPNDSASRALHRNSNRVAALS